MTALSQIARQPDSVKHHLVDLFEEQLDRLLSCAQGLVGRALEVGVWELLTEFGRELLSSLLARACWSATAAELASQPGGRLRLDRDYWLTQTTTLGQVQVPLFAYRDEGGKVRAPARKAVFPLHPKCRSSELCLEWETRLGSQLPFRQAQQGLSVFTHGATKLEDSTIARHTALIGAVLDRRWTYRSAADIEAILQEKATKDTETGKPLLYLSTDAHALRRYIDESFDASWKMVNGIRMWCVDKHTGQILHLGGEYTWGDCREVGKRFKSLIAELVPDGEHAPQVVLLTDGMEWIRTWVFPQLRCRRGPPSSWTSTTPSSTSRPSPGRGLGQGRRPRRHGHRRSGPRSSASAATRASGRASGEVTRREGGKARATSAPSTHPTTPTEPARPSRES